MKRQFLTKRTKGETSNPVTKITLSRRRSLPVLWHHLHRPKMHKVNNSSSLPHHNHSKNKRRQSIYLILMLLRSRNKRTKMISTTSSQPHPTIRIKMMGLTISSRRNLQWADKTFNNKLIICLDRILKR